MKRIILGRTELEVSVAGLGAGGHSRIGIAKYGLGHAAMIVRTAFESYTKCSGWNIEINYENNNTILRFYD